MLWLAACSGLLRCGPQEKFPREPLFGQESWMLASFFFESLWTETESRPTNTQKKNLANIQPSGPHTWPITHIHTDLVGGAVASWLVRSTPERAVRVRALAGDIVLRSWARHLTLTVPVSTQVYKWVPVICWGKPNKLWGSDLRWTTIQSRGSWNTPSRFMLQKQSWLQGFTMSAKMPKDGVKRHNFAYVWYKQINSSCMERKKNMQKLWKIRMFH